MKKSLLILVIVMIPVTGLCLDVSALTEEEITE